MYRHCIYCSADLGANDVLEGFPVARMVAFDAAKGRLWAICGRCARWNLAPLEERWEPVEEAEKLFRDTRLRVQSENIGMARLPDGARLIRVGKALPGELAAWRYGESLSKRRRKYLTTGAGVLAGCAALGGGAFALGPLVWVAWLAYSILIPGQRSEPGVRSVTPTDDGGRLVRHLDPERAWLVSDEEGELVLMVPDFLREDLRAQRLTGEEARRVLGRVMAHLNREGASRGLLKDAVAVLSAAPSAEAFLRDAAKERRMLGKLDDEQSHRQLTAPARLAVEMALHEESERRAMQGELKLLESAWREAEEIAAIADRLATSPGA